ncbi:MAG: hypothetical protein CMO74_09780 [Verrucomicrobiales bacterium]|nr:hypothetical protein [Verrucomicrobiales bacterium]|tara:strand:- start:140 stop:331 length:192 start_codon:yes stop_codon:yes gene_type:complete
MTFGLGCGWFLVGMVSVGTAADGVRKRAFHGFEDCVELNDASARVVLCPAMARQFRHLMKGGQ